MFNKYNRQQLYDLYIKLPKEIKDTVSSDATNNDIDRICERNGITNEGVGIISDLIRDVLYGILPLDNFSEELEKEIRLERGQAKKLAQEINRFIFYPIKTALEELNKIGDTKIESKIISEPIKEKSARPMGQDSYRESIE